MGNAAATLALLKILHERRQADHLDIYVLLIVRLMAQAGIQSVGQDEVLGLCARFADEYGVEVPQYSMREVLNRARKRGYVRKENQQFMFEAKSVPAKEQIDAISEKQKARIEALVARLATFSDENLHSQVTVEQADRALLGYLAKRGTDFVISAQRNGPLPKVASRSDEYRVARFIQYCYANDYEAYRTLVDVSIGYLIAAIVAEPTEYLAPFQAGLKGNHIYLDTPLALDLLGSHGPERASAMTEFLSVLNRHGVHVHIFEHSVGELSNVLNDCAIRLARGGAPAVSVGRACAHYVRSRTSPDEIVSLIENLELRLLDHRVSVCETPDPNADVRFEIDSAKLESTILDQYAHGRDGFEAAERTRVQVRRDVASIRAIYKLRRGRVPVSIRRAEHVLATDNNGLARADRSFSRQELDYGNAVSAVQTAETLCTVLWLQAPAEADTLNAKRLIADAYAVVDPDPILVDLFVKEVLGQRDKGVISQEEAYVLRSSVAAMSLLQDMTLNDPDRFTPKTADEVLDDLLRDKDKENKAALEEKDAEIERLRRDNSRTNEDADRAIQKSATLEQGVRQSAKRRVKCAGLFFVVLAVAWLGYGLYCDTSASEAFGAGVARATYLSAPLIFLVFGGSVLSMRKWIGRRLYIARCKRLGVEPGEF